MPAYGYQHAVDPREVAGMAVLFKGLWEGTLATAPFKEVPEGPIDHAVPLRYPLWQDYAQPSARIPAHHSTRADGVGSTAYVHPSVFHATRM